MTPLRRFILEKTAHNRTMTPWTFLVMEPFVPELWLLLHALHSTPFHAYFFFFGFGRLAMPFMSFATPLSGLSILIEASLMP